MDRVPLAVRARGVVLRRALGIVLAVGFALVALELALRALLFGGGALATLGAPLRRPELWADHETEDLYAALQLEFELESDGGPELARVPDSFDPELGWRSASFDSATFRHKNEAHLGARRPVLLYGDSFAACGRHKQTCWDVLLERSPLSERFAMLNYGVSGYGLDQIVLLFERTVDLYAGRDPLVLVGIFVDDDLDRVGKRLSTLPKPWFELEQGALAYRPPLASSRLEFLRAAPPSATSWAWRRVLRSGLLPREWSASLSGANERAARTAELSRLLLRRLADGLERRGLDAAVVLFHGRESLPLARYGWQEPLLVDELERLALPRVETRTELAADRAARGRTFEDYFRVRGNLTLHYSPEAQEVAFGAIERALEGRFDGAVRAPAARTAVQASAPRVERVATAEASAARD